MISLIFVSAKIGLVSWILSKALDDQIQFSFKNVLVLTVINIWCVINIWLWFWPMNRVRDVSFLVLSLILR